MPTRNVVLSDHQHERVETLVQAGRYQNASEVLREGLRLIEERERIEEAKVNALKQSESAQADVVDILSWRGAWHDISIRTDHPAAEHLCTAVLAGARRRSCLRERPE